MQTVSTPTDWLSRFFIALLILLRAYWSGALRFVDEFIMGGVSN